MLAQPAGGREVRKTRGGKRAEAPRPRPPPLRCRGRAFPIRRGRHSEHLHFCSPAEAVALFPCSGPSQVAAPVLHNLLFWKCPKIDSFAQPPLVSFFAENEHSRGQVRTSI